MKKGLACVFPGQGSQSVGMLSGLADGFPVVSEVFALASQVLGFDLWALCQEGPAERLNQTEHTQPALLTAGYAAWRVREEQGGLRPQLVAGHSLGEYTALVCAGVLEFADAVQLVADRGRFMQDAAPRDEGAMAAIMGLNDDVITGLCEQAAQGEVVSAANFNCPGQLVIAGNRTAVERALALAKTAGARRAVLLPVSVPSHCRLMLPAAARLEARVNELDFASARIPVVQNIDACARSDARDIKQALILQLHQPVLWSDSIALMYRRGITEILECGPGRVLSGLIRRIEKRIVCAGVSDTASLDEALAPGRDQG